MLDRHLDRFHRSMASARVVPPFDRTTLRGIILRTAAASGLRDGQARCLGLRVQSFGVMFRVQGLGFRVYGLGFRVYGLRFRVKKGLGFRV